MWEEGRGRFGELSLRERVEGGGRKGGMGVGGLEGRFR